MDSSDEAPVNIPNEEQLPQKPSTLLEVFKEFRFKIEQVLRETEAELENAEQQQHHLDELWGNIKSSQCDTKRMLEERARQREIMVQKFIAFWNNQQRS